MVSVNVVAKPGWILERCARELANRIPGVEYNATGYKPEREGPQAIHYFMPMKDIRHVPGGVKGKKVGFFTHGDDRTLAFWRQFDACVAMNRHVFEHLRKLGASNTWLIRPGTEKSVRVTRRGVGIPSRQGIRFGVAGRVYGKGRKGAHLLEKAVEAGFNFSALSEAQDSKGAPPCEITHDVRSLFQRQAFYHSIDYLVVTSLEEGGPMPVLEAIAHGCPVIAPDVGWCWEFPVIRYERGSWRSLLSVLRQLTEPPTWEAWAQKHAQLFEELMK